MPNKLLAMTGGGTAGHVNPNFAIAPGLVERGWQLMYVGSKGVEKELVAKFGKIAFHQIAAGKLRRYFDFQNFLDIARIFIGLMQCVALFIRRRPAVIFSKGGFVSVPVAWAGWLLRIPVVTHESDLTPGLATKLIDPIATTILYTFPETAKFLPRGKSVCAGTPIRSELLSGNRSEGQRLCGFDPSDKTPVILVMGGSQGAQRINDCLAKALPELVKSYRIIHLSGKGKGIVFVDPHYKVFEFVLDELKHLYAACDVIVSRAGANAIFEFLALHRPMLLIPLEIGSRGDQVKNAESFQRSGWAHVIRETTVTPESLREGIANLIASGQQMVSEQQKFPSGNAIATIVQEIEKAAGLSSR